MLLILIHHITTAPDIDTDTYLSSVGYARFQGLPEMILNNPICMGNGAIINGHGGPGWHGGQVSHIGPGGLIVPEKYSFVLSTCITDSDVVEKGSCDVVGVKMPCMGDCRPASRRVTSDTSPTHRWSDSECCAATIPRSTPPCGPDPTHIGHHLNTMGDIYCLIWRLPPYHSYSHGLFSADNVPCINTFSIHDRKFGDLDLNALSSQKMPWFAAESLLRVEFSVRPIW